jgi:hypothetical protein
LKALLSKFLALAKDRFSAKVQRSLAQRHVDNGDAPGGWKAAPPKQRHPSLRAWSGPKIPHRKRGCIYEIAY